MKGQIQTAVSRQLETLRSREVWLLSQVDVIESAKTGVLTQQEEQLNRALGTLHGSLEMYPKQTPLSTLDNKLSESIERYTLIFLSIQYVLKTTNLSSFTDANGCMIMSMHDSYNKRLNDFKCNNR